MHVLCPSRTSLTATAAGLVLAAVAGSPAVAASGSPTNPVNPNAVMQSDVVPTDPVVSSSGGLTRAACGPFAAYGPIGGAWSQEYKWVNCSFVGATATAKKGYTWSRVPASESEACTQGLGYKSSGPYWGATGCGQSGGGSLSWGNVWGVPKFKVKSITVVFGVPVSWT